LNNGTTASRQGNRTIHRLNIADDSVTLAHRPLTKAGRATVVPRRIPKATRHGALPPSV
jgi:hypothetical protein